MASFLIYNKTHWYDLPSRLEPDKTGLVRNQDKISDSNDTILDKQKAQLLLSRKYNARNQQGDIVVTKADNIKMCGKEPLSYVLVRVPEMDDKKALEYCVSILGGGGLVLRKCKYTLDISGIVFDKEKTATITLEKFNELVQEKRIDG